MCTIVLAARTVADAPVVVAGNRDERYGRSAFPPGRLETEPAVFAPLDLAAGGTWIGVNEHGIVGAIANRPAGLAGDRSRGWLVRTALRAGTATEARDRLQAALATASYAGCSVLVAGPAGAHLVTWDGSVDARALEPGVHVLVNDGLNAPAKARRIRAALAGVPRSDVETWKQAVRHRLNDHEFGACVHRAGAGTRSQSIIAVRSGVITYAYADGPPCVAPSRQVIEWER